MSRIHRSGKDCHPRQNLGVTNEGSLIIEGQQEVLKGLSFKGPVLGCDLQTPMVLDDFDGYDSNNNNDNIGGKVVEESVLES